jgi:hypothetical protein
MANICKLCTRPDQETVRAAFTSGATDRELARQFGVSHMAIGRHRRAHIVVPLKAAVAALDRGRTEREQRMQQLEAIENGDPAAIASALLSMETQVRKLAEVGARLSRVAAKAEQDDAPRHVAALSAQQLRGIETAAKLGGLGGFATPRDATAPAGEKFSVTIVLSGGKETKITTMATPLIEQDADRRDEADMVVAK